MVGLIGLVAMLVLLGLKVPVGIAMIAVSAVGYGYIIRPAAALARLGSDPFTSVTSYAFSVIPLFILMGLFLANAKLGSDLRSEEHTSELQSQSNLVCRLLLEKKKRRSSACHNCDDWWRMMD